MPKPLRKLPVHTEKISPTAVTYAEHVDKWRNCKDCKLCETRKFVVLGRGHVPCDIVSIGEAPGESENILGIPFIGPAGKLQDFIIKQALRGLPLTHTYTNLVSCIPREEQGGKAAEPLPEEIRACAPRLKEFIALCDPKLIVCVGKLSRNYHDNKVDQHITYHKPLFWWEEDLPEPQGDVIKVVEVIHPAAILRMPTAHQNNALRRSIVTISNAADSITKTRR